VLRRTLERPNDGSTHWSCRKLAGVLGVSKSTVQRIWAEAKRKPHRLERYMASNDPDFEAKAADVIGLYLNPPQHSAVICVDEKTAIHALDGLDPVLPLSSGRAEGMASSIVGTGPCRSGSLLQGNRGTSRLRAASTSCPEPPLSIRSARRVGPKRSISFWITSLPIRRKPCRSS
jgi:hypothetical protein